MKTWLSKITPNQVLAYADNGQQTLSRRQKFWLLHLVLPAFAALWMIAIYPHTGVDRWLSDQYYNTHLHSFSLKHDWLYEGLMHDAMKVAVILVALLTLLIWFIGQFDKRLSRTTRPAIWIFLAMLVSTSLISFLKHQSIHACPSSLTLYGGQQPYLALFQALPLGAHAGHCFPGGHASSGFALMAFYFALKDTYQTLAVKVLGLSISLGLTMGYIQVMRGEHFMSHNIWTGLIVWFVLVAMYAMFPPTIRSSSSHS